MDQPKNPPWLKTNGNSSRVLVFEQTEPEDKTKMESEVLKCLIPSIDSKEAPICPG